MLPVTWETADDLVPYPDAIQKMEDRADGIRAGTEAELVWLLEHPALYSAGTSAKVADLLTPDRLPVFKTGRGGQYTYHGPGQRVAYAMLDLKQRGGDIRRYVRQLEAWVIETLACFDVVGERREGRVGIWVAQGDGREDKIAAIGVRVRRWVSFHGISINLNPNLEHFTGIVPCGIDDERFGVTSLAALGREVTMAELDGAMKESFAAVFES